MLTINGYKFAEKGSEIVDSLFHSGGTVVGKVKRTKRKIMFYDMQDIPFAFINQHNVIGTASKHDNGKIWYSYGTPYFVDTLTYSESHSLTDSLAIGHDTNGFIFK